MPSPLLFRFADTLVRALLDDKLIEIEPGQTDDVIERLADGLTVAKHASLISTVTAVLVEDEDVVERKEIFEVHLRRVREHTLRSYQLDRLVAVSAGFSGAEIQQAIVEAMPPDRAGLRG